MPEFGVTEITVERPYGKSQIETKVKNDQQEPFKAKKEGSVWMLNVNRDHFLSRGFTPLEIDGATFLEEERLLSQVSAGSISEFNGLKNWQEIRQNNPVASSFKNLFERISALKSLEKKDQTKANLARRYLSKIAACSYSPKYPDQLLQSILNRALQQASLPASELVSNMLANLAREEQIEERSVSSLEALSSPQLSYEAKKVWFENRLLPRIEFLSRQEEVRIKETQQEQPELNKEDEKQVHPTPPETQDECEQHRGKESSGKSDPIFTIDPFNGGYWETESYDIIDEKTGRLKKSDTQARKIPISSDRENGETVCTIKGSSGTNLFSLPLILNLTPDQESLVQLQAEGIEIFTDIEGHIFIKSKEDKPYEVKLTRAFIKPQIENIQNDTHIIESALPADISEKLKEINESGLDSLEKATLWQDFVRSYFKYPKDEQVESMYANIDGNSGNRLTSITQGKVLDCYLAREFFLGGLKRLNLQDIEWRSVSGHYLSSKQTDGTGHLNSGTGHAWIKLRMIGSDEWVIFDPTPAGDPLKEGEGTMSDFDSSSQDMISQEDLKQMEEELGGLDKPKYIDPEEKYLMEFAKEADISEDEARQILSTLKHIDELKDRSGRNILQRVKEQFDRIIQAYTVERVESLGNVEMSRGRDLEEPVEAYLDIRTGSLDPKGFSRKTITEENEELYGGFDIEIVADGSGSMNNTVGGIAKYIAQQKMSYLLHRGAHYFAKEAQKRKLRLKTPLGVRSSQYIFRGNNIEEVKHLSSEFTPIQMAQLWKRSAENIGGGTPAHLGLQAVLDSIPPEELELLSDRKLLKVVALITDGGYNNPQEVERLKRMLEEINVVVAEFRVSDSKSLEELPENVAEKVIEAAKKLMPEKVKK